MANWGSDATNKAASPIPPMAQAFITRLTSRPLTKKSEWEAIHVLVTRPTLGQHGRKPYLLVFSA